MTLKEAYSKLLRTLASSKFQSYMIAVGLIMFTAFDKVGGFIMTQETFIDIILLTLGYMGFKVAEDIAYYKNN